MTNYSTDELKVGDAAYRMTGSSYTQVHKGTVVRKTATGQVVVRIGTYEVRFDTKGYEMGSDSGRYRRDFLISQERYDSHVAGKARETRARAAQALVQKLGSEHWGTIPDVEELLKRLEACAEAVRAI